MGLFSRRRTEQVEADTFDTDAELDADAADGQDVATGSGDDADATGAGDGTAGPLDSSAVTDDSDYLNLGAIWLKGQTGMELRLEVNEQEQQITGVTAVLGESAVQLQAFAAPRTEGVWVDIRNEIAKSITDAGGTAEVVSGEFGEELMTRMPQAGPDGRTVFMPARFVGVDGPRWFLRAVISGRAAIDAEAAVAVHGVVRDTVIDRGDEARPPRELLPLRLPDTAPGAEGTGEPAGEEPTGPDQEAEADGQPRLADLNPFERGPEITEVR